MRSAGPLTRLKRTSTPARVPAVASWSQAHGRALSEGGAVRHCGMKQKRPKRWFAPVWWVSLYKWAGRLTQVMLELHLTTRAHHTEQIVCETCPAPAGRVRAVMGWHKWAGRCLEPAEAEPDHPLDPCLLAGRNLSPVRLPERIASGAGREWFPAFPAFDHSDPARAGGWPGAHGRALSEGQWGTVGWSKSGRSGDLLLCDEFRCIRGRVA